MVVRVGVIYVLFFLGRLDDIGFNGFDLILDIVDIFVIYDILLEIIVVFICYLMYVIEVVKNGVYIVIIFYKVLM